MSADEPVRAAISIDIADEGLAATHPLNIEFPHAVAPNLKGSADHNSLRDFLAVVGCAMFPDVTFQFDSSLVGPEVRKATRRLARFREQLRDREGLRDTEAPAYPPIALFGHADPVGDRPYNSRLSARRALCIYGLLLHDVSIWEKLYSDKSLSGDIWGDPEFDTLLDEVGFPPELPAGSDDEVQRKQIKARLKGSAADRARLFSAYMDAVCVKEGDSGEDEPFVLKPDDFLDRGEGTDHKGAVQGCGEFNPVLILSRAKSADFEARGDKDGRNAANEPNRRVLCFMFKPGTRIATSKWPCPSATQKQPELACKKRLWKDAEARLAPDPTPNKAIAKDRTFKQGGDTFGCRFYHGLAQNSPCEGTLKLWVLRVGFDDDLRKDDQGVEIEDDNGRTTLTHPLARKRYVVETGQDPGSPIIRGRTDENGGIRLPVFDERSTMTLKLDAKSLFEVQAQDRQKAESETPESEFLQLVLQAGDLLPMAALEDGGFDAIAVRQRLSNLGYGPDKPPADWSEPEHDSAVSAFRRKHRLAQGAIVDEPLATELRKVHGS